MKSDASWVEEVMATQYVKIVTEVEEKLNKAQSMLNKCKNGYTDGLIFSINIEIDEIRELLNLRGNTP